MDTDLRIERVAITHPDAMLLVEAVQEEYVARYGGRDESPIDATRLRGPARAVLRRLPRRRAGGDGRVAAQHRGGARHRASRPRSSGCTSSRRRSGAGTPGGCSPTSRRRRPRPDRGAGAGDRPRAARGHRALRLVRLRAGPGLRLLLRLGAEPHLRPPDRVLPSGSRADLRREPRTAPRRARPTVARCADRRG